MVKKDHIKIFSSFQHILLFVLAICKSAFCVHFSRSQTKYNTWCAADDDDDHRRRWLAGQWLWENQEICVEFSFLARLNLLGDTGGIGGRPIKFKTSKTPKSAQEIMEAFLFAVPLFSGARIIYEIFCQIYSILYTRPKRKLWQDQSIRRFQKLTSTSSKSRLVMDSTNFWKNCWIFLFFWAWTRHWTSLKTY